MVIIDSNMSETNGIHALIESYGNVFIKCPDPDQAHLAPERLDAFAETERGQKILGERAESINYLLEQGIDKDKALVIALGGAIVMNGDIIVRDVEEPREMALSTPEPL